MNPNQPDYPNNFEDLSLDSYDPSMPFYASLLSQGQATTGGGYQSMDEPNFSTQPEILEDSPQETQHSSRGRGRGRARGGGSTRSPRSLWGQTEDMILISGFLNTSKDPIRNTNQSSASFWKRVSAYWNEHKPIGHPDRDEKSCKNRWQIINKSAQSFNGFYAKASRDRGSGESEADVITKAKSYYAAFNKKDFSYEDAWRVLKDEPKWSQYFVKEINKNNPSSGSAGSAKRSRSDVEGDTLNANTPTSGFSGHTIERPEGIKAAKRKGKKAASTSCDQEDEHAIEMVKIKDGWLSRAHELEMAKEARKREKQAHELAMENEQNKRAVFQKKWDLLQWMSAQTNLGEDGEAVKQKLFKELSNM